MRLIGEQESKGSQGGDFFQEQMRDRMLSERGCKEASRRMGCVESLSRNVEAGVAGRASGTGE